MYKYTEQEYYLSNNIKKYIDGHLKYHLQIKCICITTIEVPHYENGKFTNYNLIKNGSIWNIKEKNFIGHYILENCDTKRCIGIKEELFYEVFKVLTNEVIVNEEWK